MAHLPGRNAAVIVGSAVLLAAPGTAAYAGPSVEVAMTFTVTTTSDVGNGVCDAVCTLREAVAAAKAVSGRDVIVFAPALAGATITLNGSQLGITSNMKIDGGRRGVTISAGGDSRIFEVAAAAELDLIGLRLVDGVENDGGAIRSAGKLTVTACVLEANNALDSFGDGGGIDSTGGLVVSNSIFRGNQGQSGGGINSSGTLTVVASRFEDNYGYDGGGIASTGTATIVDTWFTDNFVAVDGGALSNGGTMTLRTSTVSGNTAFDLGGGVLNGGFVDTGYLVVESSTISGNSSDFYLGGGLYNGSGSTVELRNTTITNNFGDEGGGLYNSGTTTYVNSILAGNQAAFGPDDCAGGVVTSNGRNVVGSGTGCETVASDRSVAGGTVASAVVRPLAGYGGLTPTHLLRFTAGNAALDIGGSCPALDQRNFVAPVDSPDPGVVAACDAGSVETQAIAAAKVVLTPSVEPALVGLSGGSVAYTATVTNISSAARSFDVWSRIMRPDGTVTGTLFSAQTGTLAAGASQSFPVSHAIAGPAGTYEVQFFAGTLATTTIVGADAFAISKAGRG